jgi:hypothetical protein
VHLTLVVETNVGVLKINWLKVLVVPSIPLVLLVFDEEASLLPSIVEAQCWEHQLVEFPQFENIIVLPIVHVLSWA